MVSTRVQIGADLVRIATANHVAQLLLSGVNQAVTLPQVLNMLRPLGLVALGRDPEDQRVGSQAVLSAFMEEHALCLRHLRAALRTCHASGDRVGPRLSAGASVMVDREGDQRQVRLWGPGIVPARIGWTKVP